MSKNKKNILIIAGMQSWPPSIGGTPTLMYNLFNGLDNSKFEVLTSSRNDEKTDDKKLSFKLHTFNTTKSSSLKFIWRFHFIEDIIRYFIAGYRVLINNEKYYRLFILYPDTGSIIAGYLLSKFFNIKYDVYLLDLLSESRINKIEKLLISSFQNRIIRDALNLYCLEGVANYYSNYINRKYVVLNHCLPDNIQIKKNLYKKNIISYAGQIHGISLDALQVLIKALGLGNRNIHLKVFSNIDRKLIKQYKLEAENVSFHFVNNYNELINELSQSLFLYSPVSFDSPYPDQAFTCFPTKTFDYIIAGRPIFVHGPKNCHYTAYMRKYGSAFISNEREPEKLIKEIEYFINDENHHQILKQNAKIMLEEAHLSSHVQSMMLKKL